MVISLSLECRGERCKLIGAEAPTLVKTHIFVGLAVFRRPVQRLGGVACFAAFIFKRDTQVENGLPEGTHADV